MLIAGCEFPDDLWYHVEHQVWARLQGDGSAVVGISSLGIKLAGEIYMCRPKGLGSVLEQGRSIAVIELAKSIVSVKSPVRGQVVGLNTRLDAAPELVHHDPYGAGWLARVALADWAADSAALVQGEAVAPAMQRHAMLYRVDS